MKTEVKKIDDTKREVNIEVSGEPVQNKFEAVFKKIGETAKVPGFRPGHTPRDILEKKFSNSAEEMVVKEMIPDVYHEAIKNEGLDVIDLPEISEVKIDRNCLSFRATVEVAPEIKLPKYKGIKIEYKKININNDEVKRSLDAIKESRKIDSLDDNFAKGLGYPNFAELENSIEKQLFIQKDNQQRQRIEEELIENITGQIEFKLPSSLVNKQLDDLLRQAKIDMALKGMPQDKIKEQEKEIIPKLEPVAKRQVKVYLVLAEIARKENIPIDNSMPQKVIDLLFREAQWQVS